MNGIVKFYNFYDSFFVRITRIIFAVFFLTLCLTARSNIFLFFISLFLIWETFFIFKISKLLPKLKVSENNSDPLDSFTLKSKAILLPENSENIVKNLLTVPSVKFLLGKAEIVPKDITFPEITKKNLIETSFDLVRERGGEFVAPFDIFAAFLLLSDPTTKVLFNRKLKRENLIHILRWTRQKFPNEESTPSFRPNFWGEGIGESWVYGWTLETQKYMTDFTKNVIRRRPDYFGREKEYQEIVEGLSSGQSVLLIGEEGVGKTSLLETLSIESFSGKLAGNLYHRRIFQFMADTFLAGAQNQGELEQRFVSLTDEIRHSGNIIVLIQNLETILGEGSLNLDLSGQLLPYLDSSNKDLLLVATITSGAYKKFVEPKTSFASAFKIIRIEEPDFEKCAEILIKKSFEIEGKYKILISYKALLAALNFGRKYLPQRANPGAAVILLDDAANQARLAKKSFVSEEDVLAEITAKTNLPVGLPKDKEKRNWYS